MTTNEPSFSSFFVGNGRNNPSASGGSSNPFANGSPFATSDIDIPFAGGENPFAGGRNPFAGGENPFKANQNSGSNNATIGNGNWDLGNNNATIGNGNWNLEKASYNATIGNGNWLRDGTNHNSTIGNGNWYWNSSENSTLGNGNWSFGKDNSTIGNGNWDFGSNNVVIGNGNWLFTDNNVIIGNGNWFLGNDSPASQNIEILQTLFPEIKSEVDGLIASLMGEIGEDFTVLTGNLDASGNKTYEQLILSSGNVSDLDTFSQSDLAQFFASLSGMSGTDATTGNSGCFFGCQGGRPNEPVPEPSSALSLLGVGLVYFVWSKKSKVKSKLKRETLAIEGVFK